jgi:hypothetical protein
MEKPNNTTRVESTQELEKVTETSETDSDLPEGFIQLTTNPENLPDLNELQNDVNEILTEIGVNSIDSFVFGNYDTDSEYVYLSAYVLADGSKKLLVDMRSTDIIGYSLDHSHWLVWYIKDIDTEKMYYIVGKLVAGDEVYDYKTGELLAVGTEDVEEQETEVPHREGMYGVSDKDVFDIGGTVSFQRDKVRNDVTGNWRISTIADDVQMVDYALSYYKKLFNSDNEVHCIVNFNYNTTTRISYMDGMIYVTVYDYVKGEEHDANILLTGTVLADYIVYADNGDIEKIQ